MPLITAATAREYAAKALAARKANRERQRNLDQRIADLTAKLAAIAPVSREELSGYPEERLRRVRKQLDRVDALILTEADPVKLDRLAAASMRLSEQERVLSNRPLPGSCKPRSSEPERRPYHLLAPLGPAKSGLETAPAG